MIICQQILKATVTLYIPNKYYRRLVCKLENLARKTQNTDLAEFGSNLAINYDFYRLLNRSDYICFLNLLYLLFGLCNLLIWTLTHCS